MTQPSDPLKIERRIVVVVDICSSTRLMEDLIESENHERWRNSLIELKTFLTTEQKRWTKDSTFHIYKFVGDGWILLFPPDFPPNELFSLLRRLCEKHSYLHENQLNPVLRRPIEPIGLTFGLEVGKLIGFKMNGRNEHVGRAINYACRFQSVIEPEGGPKEGKLLMSANAHDMMQAGIDSKYRVKRVLRTVQGEQTWCYKVNLFDKAIEVSAIGAT
jgi:class 3 adenylate cyclase